jgi:hypothetical protein
LAFLIKGGNKMLDLEKEEQLLRFLQLTKEGKYVEIDISSLEYIRYPFLRLEAFEEYYYYNLR